ISRSGNPNAKMLWYAAATHTILGHYEDAVRVHRQLVEMKDEWVQKNRSRLCLDLGNLYDLLGQRESALQEYEKALSEADYTMPQHGSWHSFARDYIQQAFTEGHLIHRYKLWMK